MALKSYKEALKFYHITADFRKITPLQDVSDSDLPQYLERAESRQLIHIIYGFVMQDSALRKKLYDVLYVHEDLHYQLIRNHIRKHVTLLGRPKKV